MGPENKIFCAAPFAALRIETNNHGITYKPGCVYLPQNKISSLEEFMNGSEMTEHRTNLCNGSVPSPGCARCRDTEKLGLTSTRQHLNKKLPLSDTVDIKLLDIMYSNICNLSCFMCNPESSSAISSERSTIGLIEKPVPFFDNSNYAIQAIDSLPSLAKVDLIGGEFFLFKQNQMILDKIVERNLACRIITNATIVSDAVIQRLQNIENLELEVSVDGVRDCYEFMRYPANWATTSDNIHKLRQALPNAKMKFVMVVQPLNIQHIVDTLETLNTFRLATHFQDLSTPKYLSWSILTEQEKTDLDTLVRNQLPNAKITSKQRLEIESTLSAISNSVHNGQLRHMAIDFLVKTLKHRNIKPAIISRQFGIFESFTTQLLSGYHA